MCALVALRALMCALVALRALMCALVALRDRYTSCEVVFSCEALHKLCKGIVKHGMNICDTRQTQRIVGI